MQSNGSRLESFLALRVQVGLVFSILATYGAVVVWQIHAPWYLAPFARLASLLLLLLAWCSVSNNIPRWRALARAGVDVLQDLRPRPRATLVVQVRVRHAAAVPGSANRHAPALRCLQKRQTRAVHAVCPQARAAGTLLLIAR